MDTIERWADGKSASDYFEWGVSPHSLRTILIESCSCSANLQ